MEGGLIFRVLVLDPFHITYIRCWSQFGSYLGQAAQLAILFKAFFSSSFRASGSCNKKGPKQRLKKFRVLTQKSLTKQQKAGSSERALMKGPQNMNEGRAQAMRERHTATNLWLLAQISHFSPWLWPKFVFSSSLTFKVQQIAPCKNKNMHMKDIRTRFIIKRRYY